MKTSKLSGLVLGIASMVCGRLDCSMNYMLKISASGNMLGDKLRHTAKFYKTGQSDDKIGSKWMTGAFETENSNPLDLLGAAYAVSTINSIFGMGVGLELGYSGHKEKSKALDTLTLEESFVFKPGVVFTLTDWFMFSLGLRATQLTMSHDGDVPTRNTLGETLGLNADSKASSWVWGAFLDASLLIPITDWIKAVVTVGTHWDLNTPEFTKLGKRDAVPEVVKMVGPALVVAADGREVYVQTSEEVMSLEGLANKEMMAKYTQGATDAYSNYISTQDVDLSIHNRMGLRLGAGLIFNI